MRMTRLVISFNRHYFGIAILACLVGLLVIWSVDHPFLQVLIAAGVGLAAWFIVASVIASYIVYDASDLYRLQWWPRRCLETPPDTGVLIHAGFDPTSPAIRQKFPALELRVLDFFDPQTTTEASIQRAHRTGSPTNIDEATAFDRWPVPDSSQDVVFALSAAHELRREEERIEFFREAGRVIAADGRIIVIEQLRDTANFACFGFAAFHFLSRSTWLRSFRAAGLHLIDEFKISPFMSAFVLQPETDSGDAAGSSPSQQAAVDLDASRANEKFLSRHAGRPGRTGAGQQSSGQTS